MDYECLLTYIKPEKLKVGSVLIFGNSNKRDTYIIAYNDRQDSYLLLSLDDFHVYEEWEDKKSMHKKLVEEDTNGYQLIEVIPSSQLKLGRKNAK